MTAQVWAGFLLFRGACCSSMRVESQLGAYRVKLSSVRRRGVYHSGCSGRHPLRSESSKEQCVLQIVRHLQTNRSTDYLCNFWALLESGFTESPFPNDAENRRNSLSDDRVPICDQR